MYSMPNSYSSHPYGTKESYSGYGVHACDLQFDGTDIKVYPQQNHFDSTHANLVAQYTTLPLLPEPVNCTEYLSSYCSYIDIKEKYQKMKHQLKHKKLTNNPTLSNFLSGTALQNDVSEHVIPYLPKCCSSYTGGALSTIGPQQDNVWLFSSSGKSMNQIAVTIVDISSHENIVAERISLTDNCNSSIVETDACCCADKRLLLTRAEDGLVVLWNVNDTTHKCEKLQQYNSKEMITSISLSRDIEGEALLASKTKLYLWSTDGEITEYILHSSKQRAAALNPWVRAQFGDNPRQAVITDPLEVQLLDMRTRSPSTLFTLHNNSRFHDEERLTVSQAYPNRPQYHLVATDWTLLVLDQRMPNHPVLDWVLPCPGAPQFISGAVLESADTFLIGCQKPSHTLCYQMSAATFTKPAQSLSTPWKIAHPSSMLRLGVLEEKLMDPSLMLDRLDAPSAGVSLVPTQDNKGFISLQMSIYGDIFHQTYYPDNALCSSDKTLSGCAGADGHMMSEEQIKYCKSWIKKVIKIAKQSGTCTSPLYVPDIYTEKIINSLQITAASFRCSLCSSTMLGRSTGDNNTLLSNDESDSILSSQQCYSCGNTLEFADTLTTSIKMMGISSFEPCEPVEDLEPMEPCSGLEPSKSVARLEHDPGILDEERLQDDPDARLLLLRWKDPDAPPEEMKTIITDRDKIMSKQRDVYYDNLQQIRTDKEDVVDLNDSNNDANSLSLQSAANLTVESPPATKSNASVSISANQTTDSHVSTLEAFNQQQSDSSKVENWLGMELPKPPQKPLATPPRKVQRSKSSIVSSHGVPGFYNHTSKPTPASPISFTFASPSRSFASPNRTFATRDSPTSREQSASKTPKGKRRKLNVMGF